MPGRTPARPARTGVGIARAAAGLHCALLGLALAALLATAGAYVRGATGYMDNGEGLYLYPAYRLARGGVLYRDVMGTQPPVVYVIGAAAWKAGLSLAGMRLVGLAMRAACVALVYALGRLVCVGRVTAALAALVYTLLPIGLAWDRSFNSNSPLTLVILVAAYALARLTPRSAYLAGLLSAAGLFTKDLYAPVLVANVAYLLRWQRDLLTPYARGALSGGGALALALALYAGPQSLRDAFLGQASSPLTLTWALASGAYVAAQEGGVILLALVGAYLIARPHVIDTTRRQDAKPTADIRRRYAAYLLAGSSAALLATLKEGTFGTVFACAEPAVALLAAGALGAVARATLYDGRRLALAASLALLACVSASGVIARDRDALALDGTAAVARVDTFVRAHARPGDLILAPPYYALRAGTRIPYDASDTYILLEQDRRGDPVAARRVRDIVRDVAAGRFPVVVEDAHIAAFPGIAPALAAAYRRVYADTLPPSIHAVVWTPISRRATDWRRG